MPNSSVPCLMLGAIGLFGLASSMTFAETRDNNRHHVQAWEHPWTAVTMAPDGSWGVATETYVYQAIAGAVSNCKQMSRQHIGCGAQLRLIRAGWIIGMRCGRTSIIVAEMKKAAAETAASDWERSLRAASAGETPSCSRVITVNPNGNVIRHTPDGHRNGLTAADSGPR